MASKDEIPEIEECIHGVSLDDECDACAEEEWVEEDEDEEWNEEQDDEEWLDDVDEQEAWSEYPEDDKI